MVIGFYTCSSVTENKKLRFWTSILTEPFKTREYSYMSLSNTFSLLKWRIMRENPLSTCWRKREIRPGKLSPLTQSLNHVPTFIFTNSFIYLGNFYHRDLTIGKNSDETPYNIIFHPYYPHTQSNTPYGIVSWYLTTEFVVFKWKSVKTSDLKSLVPQSSK